MAEEEIKEMKEIIKAIMSSCGTYCSLRQLKRHYGDQTGENIEDTVQKLRAISLMEFLTTECQQICNVVQKNGDYRLYRISTEKSRHLDNLTKSGQKSRYQSQKKVGYNNDFNGPQATRTPPRFRFDQPPPCLFPYPPPTTFAQPPPQRFRNIESIKDDFSKGFLNPDEIVSLAIQQNMAWYLANLNLLCGFAKLQPFAFRVIQQEMELSARNIADIIHVYNTFKQQQIAQYIHESNILKTDMNNNEKDFQNKNQEHQQEPESNVPMETNVEKSNENDSLPTVFSSRDEGAGLSMDVQEHSQIISELAIPVDQVDDMIPWMIPCESRATSSGSVSPEATEQAFETEPPILKECVAESPIDRNDSETAETSILENDLPKEETAISPQDALQDNYESDEDIEFIEVSRFTAGQTFPIRIIVVESPTKFWFQCDEKGLRKLMQQMGLFYNALLTSRLTIPAAQLSQDQCVAVDFFGTWHRAIVTSPKPDRSGNIKIRFIDYGTKTEVHCDKIRYLLQKFVQISPKAIQGRLTGVTRKEGFWDLQSINAFKAKATMKHVRAKVVQYFKARDVVEMEIFTDQPSVSVGQELITEGFADPE